VGELKSDTNIARDELLELGEEGLSDVLSVESIDGLGSELGHLHARDDEALLLDGVYYLAHVGVGVGLNHSEGRLALASLLPLSGDITVLLD